jgi:hypothetical protein
MDEARAFQEKAAEIFRRLCADVADEERQREYRWAATELDQIID